MIGPVGAVAQTDAAFARGASRALSALPPQLRLAVVMLALLVSMVATGVAWVSYHQPRPDQSRPVCWSATVGATGSGSTCIGGQSR